MTIQGQNNKYHRIKKDSRDKREDPTWYPQVTRLLKGTLISATVNHHRPSKNGFRPMGHVIHTRWHKISHRGSNYSLLQELRLDPMAEINPERDPAARIASGNWSDGQNRLSSGSAREWLHPLFLDGWITRSICSHEGETALVITHQKWPSKDRSH